MSRVPIWCEIVCRECSTAPTGEFTSGAIPRRSLVKDARAAGYIFKHDEAFCSQRCLEQFEAQRATGGK